MTDLMRKGVGGQWRAARVAIAKTLPAPCPYCDRWVLPTQAWDVDHAVPYALGGTHSPANLRAAHRSCNQRAGLALARSISPITRYMRRRNDPQPSRDW